MNEVMRNLEALRTRCRAMLGKYGELPDNDIVENMVNQYVIAAAVLVLAQATDRQTEYLMGKTK